MAEVLGEIQLEPDAHYMAFYNMDDYRRPGLTDSSLLFYIKDDSLKKDDDVQGKASNLKRGVIGFVRGYIQGVRGRPGGPRHVVITTVPRSTAGKLHQFLVDFCLEAVDGIDNALYIPLLRRTENVRPAHKGGDRDQGQHERTIEVDLDLLEGLDVESQDIVFVVLDDIWTTGSTMRACTAKFTHALVTQALVDNTDIRLIAIGRTAPLLTHP